MQKGRVKQIYWVTSVQFVPVGNSGECKRVSFSHIVSKIDKEPKG